MLSLGIGSNLSFFQFQIDCFKLLYGSLIVTTKQKPIVNTQKIKRKENKYTTKESHQTMKEKQKSKGRRKEQRGTTKEDNKQLAKCQ